MNETSVLFCFLFELWGEAGGLSVFLSSFLRFTCVYMHMDGNTCIILFLAYIVFGSTVSRQDFAVCQE